MKKELVKTRSNISGACNRESDTLRGVKMLPKEVKTGIFFKADLTILLDVDTIFHMID